MPEKSIWVVSPGPKLVWATVGSCIGDGTRGRTSWTLRRASTEEVMGPPHPIHSYGETARRFVRRHGQQGQSLRIGDAMTRAPYVWRQGFDILRELGNIGAARIDSDQVLRRSRQAEL